MTAKTNREIAMEIVVEYQMTPAKTPTDLIETLTAALDAKGAERSKVPSEDEIEKRAQEEFINWNGSWDSAVALDGEVPAREYFKGMRHCYLCGFGHGYRAALTRAESTANSGTKK